MANQNDRTGRSSGSQGARRSNSGRSSSTNRQRTRNGSTERSRQQQTGRSASSRDRSVPAEERRYAQDIPMGRSSRSNRSAASSDMEYEDIYSSPRQQYEDIYSGSEIQYEDIYSSDPPRQSARRDTRDDEERRPDRQTGKRSAAKRTKTLRRVLCACLALVLLTTAGIVYAMQYLGGDYTPLPPMDRLDKDIMNVAVFGLDTRDDEAFKGNSDAIMIISFNVKTKTAKMISVQRDSYLIYPSGYTDQKICHAYSLGGPELAVQVLNDNFYLDISDYASVNFWSMAEIIDLMGGVTLEVSEAERQSINNQSSKDSASTGGTLSCDPVTSSGTVRLNGMQAVYYGRIRNVGNGDTDRTGRQREVLIAMFEELKQTSASRYISLATSAMNMVETSLSLSEITTIIRSIDFSDIVIEETVVPSGDEAQGGYKNGHWVWLYDDIDQVADRIHSFIYEEEDDGDTTAAA